MLTCVFVTGQANLDTGSTEPAPPKKRRRARRIINEDDDEENGAVGGEEEGDIQQDNSGHGDDDDEDHAAAEDFREPVREREVGTGSASDPLTFTGEGDPEHQPTFAGQSLLPDAQGNIRFRALFRIT